MQFCSSSSLASILGKQCCREGRVTLRQDNLCLGKGVGQLILEDLAIDPLTLIVSQVSPREDECKGGWEGAVGVDHLREVRIKKRDVG